MTLALTLTLVIGLLTHWVIAQLSGAQYTALTDQLCVRNVAGARCAHTPTQGPEQQPTDRINSDFYRTVDGIDEIVRSLVLDGSEGSSRFRRSLNGNQITGTIPSTIGQMAALFALYVEFCSSQCML